jgi:Ca2+-binding EF-hand superfamily protein
MKSFLSTAALAVAALLTGHALAGDEPHGIMRADTNADGKVSKEEAAAHHDKAQGEWFTKIDTNGDGYLTQEEVRQARETRHQMHGGMKGHMADRFKEADSNGDGQLSLDEAQAKMPRLAERFTTLDTDKNGMLSKEELKKGGPGRAQPQN